MFLDVLHHKLTNRKQTKIPHKKQGGNINSSHKTNYYDTRPMNFGVH